MSGKWLSEDWDLELGFSGVSVNNTNKKWETSGSEANNIRYDDLTYSPRINAGDSVINNQSF